MKVASVVGARPQFIKLSALSFRLRKYHNEIIIHTGQHYDEELSALFFKELKIPKPDYDLEVGSGSQAEQTGKMLIKLEQVLEFEKPNLVLVYGDTNSTLAGALAASKLQIPLAHIEAGMRSYTAMPEEINRKVTDHLSQILFCPTPQSVKNLKKEGITKEVYLVGDLMFEALLSNLQVAQKKSTILKKLNLDSKNFYLATIHRAENTDYRENLVKITKILESLDKKTIFPVHPRTRKYLEEYQLWNRLKKTRNLLLLDPISYLDMLVLEQNASLILTDSGGVQREAYFLKTPCLILRERTEWTEITQANGFMTSSLDIKKVQKNLKRLNSSHISKNQLTTKSYTSQKILNILNKYDE
ncbi:MAG TPA: UDP-N-acetylglucosamine 2-epimerase (non-hydrolyzing) [candidate division Zixibacteria bacterium]|nr:UDP-N-acetylglucosamine 2-epimerase (non-hydrolyzing) [candidate division Zixibacteria bacterium]